MRYKIYFDKDNYKIKDMLNSQNIIEDFITETNSEEEMLAIFKKYCERAEILSLNDSGCKRFNVHVIDEWKTIKAKNYYTKQWLREVGGLDDIE